MDRAALLLAVLAISWGSILARLCGAPALTMASGRLLFAAILLLPPGAVALRRAMPTARTFLLAAGAGLLLALHFAVWISSLALTTVAASTLLVSTQPVASLLLSRILLRERPSGRAVSGILVALLGVAVIVSGDLRAGAGRLAGDLLALAGAVFAAAYLVVGRAVRARVRFPAYLLLVNGGAAACALVLARLAGQPLLPAAGRDLGLVLLMALVPHLIGHGALNWAVRRLRAYIANLAVLGEPVLASIYAYLLFGEAPAGAIYPGAALILAGVALALRAELPDGPRGEGL